MERNADDLTGGSRGDLGADRGTSGESGGFGGSSGLADVSGGYGNSGNLSGTSGYGAGSIGGGSIGGGSIGGGSAGLDQGDQGLADRAGELAGNAKDKLADVGSTVRDRATDLGGTVRDKAGSAKNALADALESGAGKLRQRSGTSVSGFDGSAAAASSDTVSQVSDRLAGGMQATADWLRDADLDGVKSGIERQVKEHPGRTLLIALGAGYLLGKALRK